MRRLLLLALSAAALVAAGLAPVGPVRAASKGAPKPEFHTSDRCVACHNGLKTSSGEDVSIGYQWNASIMANAGRDPYWQGSVRRETIDHPEASTAVQSECAGCHMPMQHLTDHAQGIETGVLNRLPLTRDHGEYTPASDGVSCSVCHQIEKDGLGTPKTFNGNVMVANANGKQPRPEYGPFDIDAGHQRIMQSSTKGFQPQKGDQIRDAALCGSCHTLITAALGPDGKEVGRLPEQMPYQEWQHSAYVNRRTCQDCHMPVVSEAMPITATFGQPREGLHRHVFVGANFLMQNMLDEHREELAVKATSGELQAASAGTAEFLRSQAAGVSVDPAQASAGQLAFDVTVMNRSGHKLPTAYPSRRVWLHVTVRDTTGKVVFESGHLNADGSIVGNDNDADPLKFEPHHAVITKPDDVQIFEPILKDPQGRVTTGLLSAVDYFKDNRILPEGFDKATADHDVRVVGEAAEDENFKGGSARTRYQVTTVGAVGPFRVEAEVWYQPIGFRWAHNLDSYKASEPQRFVGYFKQDAGRSAVMLAKTQATY